jgi:hypothetical protein
VIQPNAFEDHHIQFPLPAGQPAIQLGPIYIVIIAVVVIGAGVGIFLMKKKSHKKPKRKK